MTKGTSNTSTNKWFVAVIALLGISAGMAALPLYTMSLFLGPLNESFGWRVEDAALATTFLYGGLFIGAPVLGLMADRLGARPVILVSTIWTILMLFMISQSRDRIAEFYAMFFLLGLGGAGTTTVTYARVITALFDAQRGLALGIMIAGGSFAAIVCAPVIEHMMAEYGWRTAYIAEAAWPLAPLILVWLFLRMPAAMTRKEIPAVENQEFSPDSGAGWGIIKTGPFWTLAIANFSQAIVVSSIIIFILPVLTEQGLPRSDAVRVISVIGIGALIGRISAGYFLDRFRANRIAFVLMFLGAVALLGLVGGFNPYASVFVLGVCFGSEGDVIAYFVGRFFRLEVFSRVYGLTYAFAIGGLASGPLVMRLLKPEMMAYSEFLSLVSVPLLSVSALLFLRLGKYPMLDLLTPSGGSRTDDCASDAAGA